MSVTDTQLEDAKQQFVDNSNFLQQIVQGNDATSVVTPSGAIDTIRKLQKNVLQDYATVEQQANKDGANGYAGLTNHKLNLFDAAGAVKSYLASLATAARNWSLPDKDGTLATTVDVSDSAALQEKLLNKAVDFTTVNDTLFPSIQAVKTYVDSATAGLLNDRGSWDASGNTFPNAGGSGSAGAIRKGDTFFISVAGTLGGVAVNNGDTVRAMVNAPGQTAANWNILESNIGYVPENVVKKDATDGYAGLTQFKLNVLNAAGNVKSFFTTLATAQRTYTLPDKDGTIAMISDFATGTLSAVLTGLSVATNAAVVAADSVLVAIGKLQAQITATLVYAKAYDFHAFVSGKPAASATVLAVKAGRAFTVPQNLTGTQCESLTASAAASVFSLKKNGTQFATINFAAAATVPTFTAASATSFAVGDKLTVTAPASQDTTLADVMLTLLISQN